MLVIILGFFPFVFGLIGNFLPFKLTDSVINKLVKAVEFRASVKVTTGIVVYVLYLLLLLIIILMTGNYKLIFLLFALPFFGYYVLMYTEYFRKWRMLRQLKKVNQTDLENFQEIRQHILSDL